jgi:tRNA(fMet)-specific endonuclease VapC
MVCLDTDVIVNFLRNEKETVNLFRNLTKGGHLLKTTTINGFELWKGVYHDTTKKDSSEAVERILEKLERMSLDDDSSKKAAEIFELLASRGETIDLLDIMIASIAIVNNEPILTHNKKHFKRIPEVKLMPLEAGGEK